MLEGVMDDVVEPAAEDLQLPRVLAALAEPNRLATVQYVARSGESCCSEVIQEAGLAMTKSTFSHHLRILREAGVLTKRIQGTKGYTKLRKDDLDRRFPGLIDAIIDAENQDPVSRTDAWLRLVRHTLLTRGDPSSRSSGVMSDCS